MKRRPFDITRKPNPYLAEFIDHDYLDKLSDEERAWLNDFDRAYYQGAGNRADELSRGDAFPKSSGRDGRSHKDRSAGYARHKAIRRDAYGSATRLTEKEIEKKALTGEEE